MCVICRYEQFIHVWWHCLLFSAQKLFSRMVLKLIREHFVPSITSPLMCEIVVGLFERPTQWRVFNSVDSRNFICLSTGAKIVRFRLGGIRTLFFYLLAFVVWRENRFKPKLPIPMIVPTHEKHPSLLSSAPISFVLAIYQWEKIFRPGRVLCTG